MLGEMVETPADPQTSFHVGPGQHIDIFRPDPTVRIVAQEGGDAGYIEHGSVVAAGRANIS